MFFQVSLFTASSLTLALALPLQQQLDQTNSSRSKEEFSVTTDFPGVPFRIPPSYAGLLPISDDQDEQNELFFWCVP